MVSSNSEASASELLETLMKCLLTVNTKQISTDIKFLFSKEL